MLFAELAEIVVFGGEPFDERFRVGHADLLAEAVDLFIRVPRAGECRGERADNLVVLDRDDDQAVLQQLVHRVDHLFCV